VKTWFEFLLFATVARCIQLLPLRTVRRIAGITGSMLFRVLPMRKQLTLSQLRRAFPDTSDDEIRSIARQSYINLLTTIFELMWTPRLDQHLLAREVRFRNPELLEQAVKRGNGVVLMSGHFGNWEWLCLRAGQALGQPVTVIVHPVHNPRVDALVERWRTMHGNRVVGMGVAVREIVRTLRARGVIAMLADQSGPSGAYYVRFFGRYAATYEGPAAFALKTGATVIMGCAVRREDGGYEAELMEIPSRDLKGAADANLHELTRRHVRALEAAVHKHPGLWLWQHKRWKHNPRPDNILIDDPAGE
jgi:Kdo2-lipid IVA lauroyltransferase/acyltransferase